jgi:ferredoxin
MIREVTGRELIVVDPLRCDGVRICAHAAGSVLDLDRWGYPVAPERELTRRERRAARAAVAACPRRALALVPVRLDHASGEPPVTPRT